MRALYNLGVLSLKLIIGMILLLVTCTSYSIDVTTEHSEKVELATVDMLQALRKSHNTGKWEFTDKVHIDKNSIPHSHPILTLHTRHTSREQKDILLSTYLHEQIHWYLDKNQEKADSAIAELKNIFKDVPVGFPQGARDEYSTYLHLLVCYLELEAISELLSKQRVQAVSLFLQQDHYTWIYEQVEKNKYEISKIIDKNGLKII
jgi:hypothetical protein